MIDVAITSAQLAFSPLIDDAMMNAAAIIAHAIAFTASPRKQIRTWRGR